MFKTSMIALALTVGIGSAAFAANPMVGGAEMFDNKTIVENAMNSKDHTTLVSAVKAAGLGETLMGKGPYTVFAPTNDAFSTLPAGAVDGLLKPEMKDQLGNVLKCHVVEGNAMAADIAKMTADGGGMTKIKTVGGCELTVKVDGDKVMITDENGTTAHVTVADVKQSNGVVHVIDKVFMPKKG